MLKKDIFLTFEKAAQKAESLGLELKKFEERTEAFVFTQMDEANFKEMSLQIVELEAGVTAVIGLMKEEEEFEEGVGASSLSQNPEDIELVDELPYDAAIRYLSRAYLAIHMYTFKVVGRLTQDCAALGVPMVGTIANFPNRLCFPSLSVKDYCVVEAAELATELLMSPYKYTKIREYALRQSKFYGIEATKTRILKLLTDDKGV